MKIRSSIHTVNHLIKAIIGTIEWLFGNPNPTGELVVINYHGTPLKFSSNFEKQLQFFQKKFTLIAPSDLDSFYNNTITKSSKPFLLLTFDDGVLNNLVAADVLNKYNLKAYFFVVPDFINTKVELQKEYFITHIRPTINPILYNCDKDFKAISWIDLKKLANNGHHIGSHTKTHTLVNTDSVEKIQLEIIESKNSIEKEIQLESVNSFCSINESSLSINKISMDLVKKNYDYFFSTYPASNLNDKNKLLIYRCNIESYWLLGAVKYAIGKWDQKRWVTKIDSFKKLVE